MSSATTQDTWQPPAPAALRMNLRYIDWIWHVRDSVPLPGGQTASEALDRIEPMLDQMDTTHERVGETITFTRKAPVPQDPLSTFEDGVLTIAETAQGKTLRYHLISKALLFCFLLPLLFVGFGQLTLVVGEYQMTQAEAKKKAAGADKKDKKDEAKVLALNPVDKMLGAPAPEKPKKKEDSERKPSATAAYVFSALFALLYVVGRFLEPWLVRRRFIAQLTEA